MQALIAVLLLSICGSDGRRLSSKHEFQTYLFEDQENVTEKSRLKSQSDVDIEKPSRLKPLGVLAALGIAHMAQGFSGALHNPGVAMAGSRFQAHGLSSPSLMNNHGRTRQTVLMNHSLGHTNVSSTPQSAQFEELQNEQGSSTYLSSMNEPQVLLDSPLFIQSGEEALDEYRSQFEGMMDDDNFFNIGVASSPIGVAAFGAVEIPLPLGISVVEEDGSVVVDEVVIGGNAARRGIKKGDIVRAISAADSNAATAKDAPWWRFFYAVGLPTTVPPAEQGMIFLDGTTAGGLKAILRNNLRVQGLSGEVVLLIERFLSAQQDKKPPAQDSVMGETIIMRPGFLGFKLDDVNSGRIGDVDEGGQAGRLGVRPGWQILKLNGEDYSYELLQSLKEGSVKYSITVTSKSVSKPVSRPYNLRYKRGNMQELQKRREGVLENMLAAVRKLRRLSSTKLKLADAARQMDKMQDKNKGAQYYFHLNALSEVRRANDRLYRDEIDRYEELPATFEELDYTAMEWGKDRTSLEELPEVDLFHLPSGELDRNLRQKGPDGKKFVRRIADPTNPKSDYLKRLQQDFSDRDLLTRLDNSLEDVREGLPNSRNIMQTPSEEDFLSSSQLEGNLRDPRELAVNDRILISLGMQVIKRRRLGEPGLTARSLWSRIVARTDEIYQVCEQLDASYRSVMTALLRRNGLDETAIVFGALKDPVRIYEKAIDDYSIGERNLGDGVLPEAWVNDVLRCTITVTDIRKIAALQKDFLQLDGSQVSGAAGIARLRLVRSKNKFRNLGVTHFRHILNNFELCLGSRCVIFEMQVQQTNIRELDGKLDGHYHYTYFRAALERLIQRGRQKDTGAGAAGQNLDDEIVARLEAYDEVVKRLPWYGWDSWIEDDETNSPSSSEDKQERRRQRRQWRI